MRFGFSRKFLPFAALIAFFANPTYASESMRPETMFKIAGLPVTNSMLTTAAFCVIIALVLRFVLLKGGAKIVPSKGQLVFETIIDVLGSVLEPMMGKRAYKAAAPYLLTLFTFILSMNLSGMLPGVGSVGMVETAKISVADSAKYEAQGFEISNLKKEQADASATSATLEASRFVPFIRPAHTDMNMTLALALISFAMFFYFVKKYAGFGALYKDWFGNKADKNEVPKAIYYGLFPIFFALGIVEVISACIRPLSLSLRLFGNVFGGETLLSQMHHLAWSGGILQFFTWILPLPFYFLELLVALVQAFVFTLLTALYIGLITGNEEDHHSQVVPEQNNLTNKEI